MTRYRASCDCGFDRTYDSEAKAAYALRLHSCSRSTARAGSRARRLAREAAIDRTPKSCGHKKTDHQHGTNAAYTLDRCRCRPCARAHSDTETWRERQKAYGRYDRYVDAEPVRRHVRSLMEFGMGLKRISAKSGVSHGGLSKLIYGTRRADGTRTGSKRLTRTTADQLLATELDLAAGAKIEHDDAIGTTRRIRALVALGWSQTQLADRLGVQRSNFYLATGERGVTVATAKAVEQLYDELSMTLPPQTNRGERNAASRSRNYAKARGWLPPLALNDDALDDAGDYSHLVRHDVDEQPALDEQAIFRRERGDRGVALTVDETTELVRRWQASGRPLNECQRVTGINPHRYLQKAA